MAEAPMVLALHSTGSSPVDPPTAEPDNAEPSRSKVPEHICHLCNQILVKPRVLACLHTFCLECLRTRAEQRSNIADTYVIKCSHCAAETNLGPNRNSVEELPVDHVMENSLEIESLGSSEVSCTSCTLQRLAISRCLECACYLCRSCSIAHRYMKCFDNHQLVALETIIENKKNLIHQALYCRKHVTERLSSVCVPCELPLCVLCENASHLGPSHFLVRAQDKSSDYTTGVEKLVLQCRAQGNQWQTSSCELQNQLSELQEQCKEISRSIEDTFSVYVNTLHTHKCKLLVQLEKIHSTEKEQILQASMEVDQRMQQMEYGCKFSQKLLEYGNAAEIANLKPFVTARLTQLSQFSPKSHVPVSFSFEANPEAFYESMKKHFGHLNIQDNNSAGNASEQSENTCRCDRICVCTSQGLTRDSSVVQCSLCSQCDQMSDVSRVSADEYDTDSSTHSRSLTHRSSTIASRAHTKKKAQVTGSLDGRKKKGHQGLGTKKKKTWL